MSRAAKTLETTSIAISKDLFRSLFKLMLEECNIQKELTNHPLYDFCTLTRHRTTNEKNQKTENYDHSFTLSDNTCFEIKNKHNYDLCNAFILHHEQKAKETSNARIRFLWALLINYLETKEGYHSIKVGSSLLAFRDSSAIDYLQAEISNLIGNIDSPIMISVSHNEQIICYADKDDLIRNFFVTTTSSQMLPEDKCLEIAKRSFPSLCLPNGVKPSEVFNQRKRIELANDVIRQAEAFPLIGSLISSKKNKLIELRDLLIELTSFEYDSKTGSFKAFVASPIKFLLEHIYSELSYYTSKSDFSGVDYTRVMGAFAFKARLDKENHIFTVDYADENLKMLHVDKTIIDEIVDAAINTGIIIEAPNAMHSSSFKFKLKQYRLLIEGLGAGLDLAYSKEQNIDSRVKHACDKVMRNDETETGSDHTNRSFPGLMVFACGFLLSVDSRTKMALLDKLCEIAKDFRKTNRIRQIKALCALSYYLVHDQEKLTDSDRKRFFKCSYGKTMYKSQADLFPYLSNKAPVLLRYAAGLFEQACKLETIEQHQYAKGQPLFNFIISDMIPFMQPWGASFDFLRECSEIYRCTWYLSHYFSADVDRIFSLLKKANEQMSFDLSVDSEIIIFPEDVPSYVYGANLLFYSMANLKLLNIENAISDICSHIENDSDNILYKVLIKSDYLGRLFNKQYSENIRANDYHLLSGPKRFISMYRNKIHHKSITISDSIKRNYDEWLRNETDRNRILILLLLLNTDYDNSAIADLINFAAIEDDDIFMDYDGLSGLSSETLRSILRR